MSEGTPRRVVRSASFVQKAAYDRAVARAEAAEARAVAAEARLAIAVRALSGIRAVVGTSTEAYHMARDALAIIGTEEEGGDAGDDWSFTDPAL